VFSNLFLVAISYEVHVQLQVDIHTYTYIYIYIHHSFSGVISRLMSVKSPFSFFSRLFCTKKIVVGTKERRSTCGCLDRHRPGCREAVLEGCGGVMPSGCVAGPDAEFGESYSKLE